MSYFKKMKILAFTDVHNSSKAMENIEVLTKRKNPDMLICAGDLSIFEQGFELDIKLKLIKGLAYKKEDRFQSVERYRQGGPMMPLSVPDGNGVRIYDPYQHISKHEELLSVMHELKKRIITKNDPNLSEGKNG